jgi:DNA-binding FadR family transcriptional regulator
MLRPPQRQSLVAQTAAIVREHIDSSREGAKLESERELCHELGVSRLTLRAALARLVREGRLQAGRGRRRVITTPNPQGRTSAANRDVVVLSPARLHAVEPRVLFWIDELRDALAKESLRLTFVDQRNCYTDHPERALEELTARLRPAVWLLYLSTRALQQWFFARGLPAVIPGSRHDDVRLLPGQTLG